MWVETHGSQPKPDGHHINNGTEQITSSRNLCASGRLDVQAQQRFEVLEGRTLTRRSRHAW